MKKESLETLLVRQNEDIRSLQSDILCIFDKMSNVLMKINELQSSNVATNKAMANCLTVITHNTNSLTDHFLTSKVVEDFNKKLTVPLKLNNETNTNTTYIQPVDRLRSKKRLYIGDICKSLKINESSFRGFLRRDKDCPQPIKENNHKLYYHECDLPVLIAHLRTNSNLIKY